MNKPSTQEGIHLIVLGVELSSCIEPGEEACHE